MLTYLEKIGQEERIKLCRKMEEAAKSAAMAGGMAAMGFYRGALKEITSMDELSKNPSTDADLQATISILQTIHPILDKIRKKIKLQASGVLYFGEEVKTGKSGEIKYKDILDESLSHEIHNSILPPGDFFDWTKWPKSIKVIFDGIDGTGSFMRGIPLFCSAVAMILGDQVRVSAVYDPIHHTLYSGYLPGPADCPEKDSLATAWEIATGNTTNLTERAERSIRKELRKEAIALHFTRSYPERLHEILAVPENRDKCFFENLATRCGSIYAINSGLMAMTQVADGGMGAFINNITNSWDVAAGEVLIKACGGRVTGFDGKPIKYSKDKISVLSAKEHLHSEILDIITQSMK